MSVLVVSVVTLVGFLTASTTGVRADMPNCSSGVTLEGFNVQICLSTDSISANVSNIGQNQIRIKMDGIFMEPCPIGQTSCTVPVNVVAGSTHSVTAQIKNGTVLISAFGANLTAPSADPITVTITSPANATTVVGDFNFTAVTSAPATIKLWVDNGVTSVMVAKCVSVTTCSATVSTAGRPVNSALLLTAVARKDGTTQDIETNFVVYCGTPPPCPGCNPTPTPTPSPTPVVTPPPTPTPSRTPTPTPTPCACTTPTPTPSRTPTPTPTPSVTPTPTPTPSITPTPTFNPLVCSPSNQSVNIGQVASLVASGGSGHYSWFAQDGFPFSGQSSYFATIYLSSGTKTVRLTDSVTGLTRNCFVNVNTVVTPTPTPSVTPTPTPTPSVTPTPTPSVTPTPTPIVTPTPTPSPTPIPALSCSSVSSANINQNVTFVANGGNGSYYWSAPNANPNFGLGQVFNTVFASAGFFRVVANSGGQSAFCYITVNQPVVNQQNINIQKLGTNITQGQTAEQSNVAARPNDTLQFVVRVRSLSSTTINNVIVKDILPNELVYISGTTSRDGTIVADGIISDNGINIGSLSPNQEVVIRFNTVVRSTVSFTQDTTALVNTVNGRADNVPTVIAQATVTVTRPNIPEIAGAATGTNGSLMLSLMLGSLAALMYFGYTQSGLYKARKLYSTVAGQRNKDFNFILKR